MNITSKISLLLICLTFSLISNYKAFAQCAQQEVMNKWFEDHPEELVQYEKKQNEINSEFALKSNNRANSVSSAVLYTIPIVFHILHEGGSENISDAQVIDEVNILNRDFQKMNADTSLIVPAFANNIANIGFEFKLATLDPDGNCTNGIIRHYTNKTNWLANNLPYFAYTWPRDRYLNIYVVKNMDLQATAYAYLPGSISLPDADVIVAINQVVGSIGTSGVANSRVLTHEVGHWFNLQHMWGSSNLPGVACGDDGVSDTPITKGFLSCSSTTNTIVCTPGIIENNQNYMDYSPCKIMFTNGQAARMYSCINGTINNRLNIFTPTNLAITGVSPVATTCLPSVDFYATKTSNCSGNVFQFTSDCQLGAAGGTILWSFPGGTPTSSTNLTENVIYSVPGTYAVTLSATNSAGTTSETRNTYITVVSGASGLTIPYAANFETAALPTDIIIQNDDIGSVEWAQDTLHGANSTSKAIYLDNFNGGNTSGHRDYFETPYFDLSTSSSITFSFYYAYAKLNAAQIDSFSVQYTTDCGFSWKNIFGIPNLTTMANNSGGIMSSAFYPTPAQWKKVSVPSVLLAILANTPNVKIRFYFKSDEILGASNNIFIDEINLGGVGSLGIAEASEKSDLLIYPNPSFSKTVINFDLKKNEKAKIKVLDVVGNVLEEIDCSANQNERANVVVNQNGKLAKGIYIVQLNIDNRTTCKKLVIE